MNNFSIPLNSVVFSQPIATRESVIIILGLIFQFFFQLIINFINLNILIITSNNHCIEF